MSTSRDRIEKAKRKYAALEHKTDSLLTRLVSLRYTLIVVFVACAFVLWLAMR